MPRLWFGAPRTALRGHRPLQSGAVAGALPPQSKMHCGLRMRFPDVAAS